VTVTEVGDLVVDAGGSKASGFKKIKEVMSPLNPETKILNPKCVDSGRSRRLYQTFALQTLKPFTLDPKPETGGFKNVNHVLQTLNSTP
jgi:hypothetical protein